jgi:H+/Cl- antiporter ClcA
MKLLLKLVRGQFEPATLRIYLAAQALFFWVIIFVCWRLFPVENAFSILTHTFSYLGSFEPDRNPPGWWLFCIAMVFWGLSSVPVVRYITRQVALASGKPLRGPARLLTTGCAGIVLVGLFPDARGAILGSIRWTDLHYLGAIFVVIGFVFGVPWFAAHLFRAARSSETPEPVRTACRRARLPQLLFIAEATVALSFLIRWEFVYRERRAVAEAAGTTIGSSWTEAMNTPYSFPLWDNLFVYTLFVYLAWTALALSSKRPG